MPDFEKVTDRRGTHIVEGEKKKDTNGAPVFSITRFICAVHPQPTSEETEEVANIILKGLELVALSGGFYKSPKKPT